MANGDITLPTPKSVPLIVLAEVDITIIPSAFLTVSFFETDEKGLCHTIRITNAVNGVLGFDYSAGVFTEGITRALTGYLTTILGVLFIGNASTLNQRKTALVQRLITDNVITGFTTGNVG